MCCKLTDRQTNRHFAHALSFIGDPTNPLEFQNPSHKVPEVNKVSKYPDVDAAI